MSKNRKLCYRVGSDFLMQHIVSVAETKGIITYMTKDTQDNNNNDDTATVNAVLALGPAPLSILQNILGNLTLME